MLKELEDPFYQRIIGNIIKIANERNITQATLSEYVGISQSQMSKVIKCDVSLSIVQLSNLATGLGMRFIDIITYPECYVEESHKEKPVKAVLQIELSEEKRDQVFRLMFGDNELQILNK